MEPTTPNGGRDARSLTNTLLAVLIVILVAHFWPGLAIAGAIAAGVLFLLLLPDGCDIGLDITSGQGCKKAPQASLSDRR
jgi:hypothetical protein